MKTGDKIYLLNHKGPKVYEILAAEICSITKHKIKLKLDTGKNIDININCINGTFAHFFSDLKLSIFTDSIVLSEFLSTEKNKILKTATMYANKIDKLISTINENI